MEDGLCSLFLCWIFGEGEEVGGGAWILGRHERGGGYGRGGAFGASLEVGGRGEEVGRGRGRRGGVRKPSYSMAKRTLK